MRVLIAFDKFKDSLTAREACRVTARVLAERHPDWELDLCPLADGGDGFATVLTEAAGGGWVEAEVTGPRGKPVQAGFGLVDGEDIPLDARNRLAALVKGPLRRVALVEMASASGLALLSPGERDLWQCTSRGTGELMLLASARDIDLLLVGIGGSATHDLGLGALGPIGVVPQTARGEAVDPLFPARWSEVEQLAGRISTALPPIAIACDVTNPLLGPMGAATLFAPQKGLRAQDLSRLEEATARMAALLCTTFAQPGSSVDFPGAGAAGGFAFGMKVAAGAIVVGGADLVADWLGLAPQVAAADLVISGEGCFDEQSRLGKGAGALLQRARDAGKRALILAGAVDLNQPDPAVHAITPAGEARDLALAKAASNLAAAVARIC